jgi:beta-N-acetylhexosaminidase
MTREELAQLFVFGFEGTQLPKEARTLLSQNAGGVILFRRNIEETHQLVSLITEIHSARSEYDFPLISVDQEGGRVQRLKDICTYVPTMAQVGQAALKDDTVPYKLGALMGRELAALGFHLDFTPVMDVNSNPNNPVIGERSFSHDPMWVSECGAALIRGMQGAGVSACAKHFPGHGDTALDSHHDLPVLHHAMERLQKVEWPPFEAAIHAGVATMMTAHVLFPELDSKLPATLSPRILNEILIQKMGFDGLIFSDDLEMKALADHHSLEEMIHQGLCAGVDIFLICKDTQWTEEALNITHRLVEHGHISKERIARSLKKIAAWKKNYVGQAEVPDINEIKSIVQCQPHTDWMASWSPSEHNPQKRAQSPVDD